MRVLLINGPNLNLTGIREPAIYGTTTFDTFLEELRTAFAPHQLEYYQSNHEGALIDKLHAEGFSADYIILNAGALTHTSLALADAVAAIASPVIEVHMSNVAAREAIRHQSLLARHCLGSIVGFGLSSYRLALQHALQQA